MTDSKQPAKDVIDFLSKCSDAVGRYEADSFSQYAFCEFYQIVESPIEQILLVAVMTVAHVNVIGHWDQRGPKDGPLQGFSGLHITPQKQIGAYRVDFHLEFADEVMSLKGESRQLVVECDSQAFHERDERERRYEKRRDRYFASKGLKVFHFTGTEIKREPIRVATEILDEVTGHIPCKPWTDEWIND